MDGYSPIGRRDGPILDEIDEVVHAITLKSLDRIRRQIMTDHRMGRVRSSIHGARRPIRIQHIRRRRRIGRRITVLQFLLLQGLAHDIEIPERPRCILLEGDHRKGIILNPWIGRHELGLSIKLP